MSQKIEISCELSCISQTYERSLKPCDSNWLTHFPNWVFGFERLLEAEVFCLIQFQIFRLGISCTFSVYAFKRVWINVCHFQARSVLRVSVQLREGSGRRVFFWLFHSLSEIYFSLGSSNMRTNMFTLSNRVCFGCRRWQIKFFFWSDVLRITFNLMWFGSVGTSELHYRLRQDWIFVYFVSQCFFNIFP